jgi:hypothetical protein
MNKLVKLFLIAGTAVTVLQCERPRQPNLIKEYIGQGCIIGN